LGNELTLKLVKELKIQLPRNTIHTISLKSTETHGNKHETNNATNKRNKLQIHNAPKEKRVPDLPKTTLPLPPQPSWPEHPYQWHNWRTAAIKEEVKEKLSDHDTLHYKHHTRTG